MAHWALRYTGKAWSHKQDCFYWFRRITRERFGRDVAITEIDHSHLVLSAAREMQKNIRVKYGYEKTDNPKEGDAVFMSQRQTPHHIGMVIMLKDGMHVLHGLEGAGVVVSSPLNLAVNGWSIKGYWTYAG